MGGGDDKQVREIGLKLLKSSSRKDKDVLVKLLKQAASCLSELDQSPLPSMLESMRPCLNAIAMSELLKHQDMDVKLLVATCICEITRITAPEAPYSDDILRDIFHLMVGTFSGLGDSSSPSFRRRVVILETLARYRSCVLMLDLECDNLVNEMFSTFFAVVSDDHPESVLVSMQTIMIHLLEESEDVQESLMLILLTALGGAKSGVSMAARGLAMNVIRHCAGKLESGIKQFLISSMSGHISSLNNQINYHEIIHDISGCAPQILSAVIPYLRGELLVDQLNTRLEAVKLLGGLFAIPDPISEEFQPIFSDFLKRLTDGVVQVRLSVVEHLKIFLLSNPFRVEAPEITAALCDRLVDYDENVRKHVVAALCDVAYCTSKPITVETLKLVAERLRDKSLLVKIYTMERIAEIYQKYCWKVSDGSISNSEFDWIPGKILRCFYDKDFRSETIEIVLSGSLFPLEYTTKARVKHWITVFTGLHRIEVKALESILEQKQRLQQEMHKYLSLRQTHQVGEASELEKKKMLSFRIMSRWFIDPAKAEENFRILDQLMDANVWKNLSDLLNPNTSLHQAWTYRDDLLKILGERHPLYVFLGILSVKCSYLLFDKESVEEVMLETRIQKYAKKTHLALSCMNLLVILARFSPTLFRGTEGDIINFLKEDNDILKEGALHILARAGGTLRDQLAVANGSVDLILERLCLEGSRKQAKYAVHALATITNDEGLKSLSVLYKRLVDMLVEKIHLPPVLQSLGCIAQIAMPIFETRESEVLGFIRNNILDSSNIVEDSRKTSWDKRSEFCLLKIFGLKTLVKSYLPVKDAHLRPGIENFLTIIKNILSIGEVSVHVESSLVDKAHMKLASAKAVLRLSKYWEHKIPTEVFHLTLKTSESIYPEARKQFLGKVHQYIQDQLLDVKYACTFLHAMNASQPLEFEEYKHDLVEVIQMCFQQNARQHPIQCDANPLMTYPEYILPYLVHSFAHHDSFPNIHDCKDVGAFKTIYRQLHLFISLIMEGNADGKFEVNDIKGNEGVSTIISIFQNINFSEDIVDTMKSKNSRAICDLGLSITKGLFKKQEDFIGLSKSVPLPSALYKPLGEQKGNNLVAHGDRTWLARDKVLAHFESFELETNGNVAEAEKVTKDNERDENDMPLGQMIRNFKSRVSKTKKIRKKKVSLTETKNSENSFDILEMVREINLDVGLDRSKDLELCKIHEYVLSGEDDGQNVERSLVSKKKKQCKTGESTSMAPLKKNQPSSIQDIGKSSRSNFFLKGMIEASEVYTYPTELPFYQSNEWSEIAHAASTDDKILVEDDVKPVEMKLLSSHFKKKSFSSTQNDTGTGQILNTGQELGDSTYLIGKVGDSELKHRADDDKTNFKSSIKSVGKRKRKSISGLAKCSLKENENNSLVGCRIKVWWPLDKQFYEGTVQSYEQGIDKHEILYDDGEMETLYLDNEQWELITSLQNPKKKLKLLKGTPTQDLWYHYR